MAGLELKVKGLVTPQHVPDVGDKPEERRDYSCLLHGERFN